MGIYTKDIPSDNKGTYSIMFIDFIGFIHNSQKW